MGKKKKNLDRKNDYIIERDQNEFKMDSTQASSSFDSLEGDTCFGDVNQLIDNSKDTKNINTSPAVKHQNFNMISQNIARLGSIDMTPLILRSKSNSLATSSTASTDSIYSTDCVVKKEGKHTKVDIEKSVNKQVVDIQELSIELDSIQLQSGMNDRSTVLDALFLAIFFEAEFPLKVLEELSLNENFIEKMKKKLKPDSIDILKTMYGFDK